MCGVRDLRFDVYIDGGATLERFQLVTDGTTLTLTRVSVDGNPTTANWFLKADDCIAP